MAEEEKARPRLELDVSELSNAVREEILVALEDSQYEAETEVVMRIPLKAVRISVLRNVTSLG